MSINNIKSYVCNNYRKKVKIIYNEGRNKIIIYVGTIIDIYDNVFLIFDDIYFCKRCFSYYDILIGKVKIAII